MTLYALTISHCQGEILAHGLAKAVRTMSKRVDRWIVVDHHWPLQKDQNSLIVKRSCELVGAALMSPSKNIGGVQAINWVVSILDLEDNDLLITYDPDSNPLTLGWDKAMVEVMQADPSIPYLSLMHDAVRQRRNWHLTQLAGHQIASDSSPEMINVTCWRGSVLKRGLPDVGKLWGGLESALWIQGLRGSYLYDFREGESPLRHPQIYTDWKQQHHSGQFAGNFDEFVKHLAT